MSPSCTATSTHAGPPLAAVAALQSELESSPYWSLRQVCARSAQGRIVLRGTVTSYYLKQLALAIAARVVGVGCVQIEIDVRSE